MSDENDDTVDSAATATSEKPAPETEPVAGQSEDQESEETSDELTANEVPADDGETVEIDGKSYKVPKDLKDGYLRQGDYSRKTAEVAEIRKAIEAEKETFNKARETYRSHIADVGRLAVLDEAIGKYAQTNWTAEQQNDAATAQAHWMYYQQLKDQRDDVTKRLTQYEQTQVLTAQQETDKRREEGQRELVRDIKNWGPELASKLVAFAKQNGVPDSTLRKFEDDPHAIKMLHKAWLAENITANAKAAAQKAKPESDEEPAKPLMQVSRARTGPPPSAGPTDRDSVDDWLKKRNAELARNNPQVARRR